MDLDLDGKNKTTCFIQVIPATPWLAENYSELIGTRTLLEWCLSRYRKLVTGLNCAAWALIDLADKNLPELCRAAGVSYLTFDSTVFRKAPGCATWDEITGLHRNGSLTRYDRVIDLDLMSYPFVPLLQLRDFANFAMATNGLYTMAEKKVGRVWDEELQLAIGSRRARDKTYFEDLKLARCIRHDHLGSEDSFREQLLPKVSEGGPYHLFRVYDQESLTHVRYLMSNTRKTLVDLMHGKNF